MPYKNAKEARDYQKTRLEQKKEAGECYRCKSPAEVSRTHCKLHAEQNSKRAANRYSENVEEYRKKERERHQERRRLVFEHYGIVCVCCGETRDEFLEIDHIDGGGYEHRKLVGAGSHFYRWLIKNNFPPGFRTLCANCNHAVGVYGYCPHGNLDRPIKYRIGRPMEVTRGFS